LRVGIGTELQEFLDYRPLSTKASTPQQMVDIISCWIQFHLLNHLDLRGVLEERAFDDRWRKATA